MSKNEKTANDSYLIVKGEEKEMKKISYRGNLIEEFKKLFDGGSRLKRRAVMASVVGSLPVFFNNFDEFKDYVHISLMQCSDEAERQAVLALAKILISGD